MPQVILIGIRGAGKSTVGREIAARLGKTFADLDDRAIALAGASSVKEFMARAGEAAWRELERQAFLEATAGPSAPAIVALGGGAVTMAAIRDELMRLRESGRARVVWLSAPLATLVERLQADPGDRGSLTGLGLLDELPALLAVREPLYRGLSNLVVDTADLPVAGVADAVIARLATRETLS